MLKNLTRAQENAIRVRNYIQAESRAASYRGDNSGFLELAQAAIQVTEYLYFLERHIYAVNKIEETETNGGVV